MADAARANERGRLLGFSDFVAILGAALLSVLGRLVLDLLGLAGLVAMAVVLSLGPALLFVLGRARLQSAAA